MKMVNWRLIRWWKWKEKFFFKSTEQGFLEKYLFWHQAIGVNPMIFFVGNTGWLQEAIQNLIWIVNYNQFENSFSGVLWYGLAFRPSPLYTLVFCYIYVKFSISVPFVSFSRKTIKSFLTQRRTPLSREWSIN